MIYLFEKFELNEEDFYLSRDGIRVALEPKALRVLIVLIRNQGKLLEKKTILESVWTDTFVEDSTLTRAIALLRKQLGDDPRSPRYIETVPTLGYRFIASVAVRQEVLEEPEAFKTGNPATKLPDKTPPAAAPQAPDRRVQSNAARGRTALAYVAGLAAFALVLGGFAFYRSKRKAGPTVKDTIVLADFANTSGDPVFDDTLRQGMMVQLEQSPVLKLASEGQIRNTLKMMGMKPESRLTSEVSREICQRIAGNVVLEGSVSRLGSAYVVGMRARRCDNGDQLTSEQVQVNRKEDALVAVSQIATRFRTVIGESRTSIKNLDVPLAEATTSSLDALKSFSQGIRAFNAKGSRAAIPLFEHAIELDQEFAMAHVWLGRMYADLGEEAESAASTQKAYSLKSKASDRERFSIDVSYDLLVTGDLSRARETCEAWEQIYPRDVLPRSFLAGIIYPAYGHYEQGLDEARKTVEIDPDFVIGYRNTILNLIALDRLKDAEKTLQLANERKLFLASFVTDSYRIAFLEGNKSGMDRAVAASPNNPWLVNYQAASLLRSGHLNSARQMSDKAVSLARQSSRRDTEAQLQVAEAISETLYGYPDSARQRVKHALELSNGRSVEYGAALVMALTGSSTEAIKLTARLMDRYPNDTLVKYNYVPTIKAASALASKKPQVAIELLRDASPYELGQPLHAIYIRGQSLLAMGKPAEAVLEFQKILNHPGLIVNDPLYELAYLQLGRSYVQLGDRQRARAAYETLLKTWSSADRDLLITEQARSEYARL